MPEDDLICQVTRSSYFVLDAASSIDGGKNRIVAAGDDRLASVMITADRNEVRIVRKSIGKLATVCRVPSNLENFDRIPDNLRCF